MAEVVGLGMSTLDLLVRVPRLPRSDEVFQALQSDLQGGGPVATALAALGKWGVSTAYLGPLGADRWNEPMLADLTRFGVDTQFCSHCPQGSTTFSVLLVEPSGQRAILYKPGENLHFLPEQVAQEPIRQARLLHLDGSFPEAALHAAKVARQAQVPVSLDGGAGEGIWPGTHELLPLTDLLIVARRFAYNLTGLEDPLKAGPALLGYGARLAVITDGERGAWYFDRSQQFHQPAYRVPVVDTTGAGDTFHGAYLYAYLQGWEARRCLAFASAAAALKCRGLGGRNSLPELRQVLDLIEASKEQP